jgi:L,D-transpeptidase YcbB
LGLLLSSHAAMAQQSDKQIEAAIPLPDTALPPPTAEEIMSALTAAPKTDAPAAAAAKEEPAAPQPDKTINAAVPLPDTALPPTATAPAATAPAISSEPKQDAKAPAAEPVKAASEPAAAPAPAPGVAIADALRDLVTGKRLDRFVSNRADREGAESYYRAHNFAPLWLGDAAAEARAKAAAGYIGQVGSVGLNPLDYPLPDLQAATSPAAKAEAELKFTASVLAYARRAQIGQIHFTRIDADIAFNLVAPEPAKVLAKLADASDVAATLDSYNPPQEGFQALKAKLAELRNGGGVTDKAKEEKKRSHVHIAEGKILTKGMKDARVIALRQRLDIAGDKNNPLYDEAVEEAVKTFQTEADIGVDGDVGPNTTRALNGEQQVAHRASANPIDTILVNMERWRWLPRKLGNASNTYVVVNVPDFTLSLFHEGNLYWKTKIVAGKPGKATPMISAEMKFITVNPTWNVPPSIIQNEYLPALEADPNALDRIGLKVKQDPDGTVHVFQPPGAGNALGRIRFNFPNKFLVYQHDTPDKYLFKKEKRAYSHGCMRVENPLTYATKLLSIELPNQRYNEARLESMFGGNEINIDFPKPIPVHLTYQTAFVDQSGKLQLRDDVYGRDARMIAILKSNSERKVADSAIERRPDSSSKPVRMPVGMFGNGGDSYGSSGDNFFNRLFGIPPEATQGGGPHGTAPRVYRPRGFIGPRATNNGRFTVQ